jgi:hypothetical protein
MWVYANVYRPWHFFPILRIIEQEELSLKIIPILLSAFYILGQLNILCKQSLIFREKAATSFDVKSNHGYDLRNRGAAEEIGTNQFEKNGSPFWRQTKSQSYDF